ncbi:MAG: hypothetical protein A3F85_00060 [Candidatus Ryanbacteria bacterium RIFCSPLOWO2_12_FULL_44_26]|nr:MAG: hypothetical protein A3F85_00060 [Candidatus Ryanbacteria bacterium RIFCSPLOWO2_12_FULL_44_26]
MDGTISREEYTAKKEKLITEKAELSEKSKDFERNGNHWLEPGPAIRFSGSTSQNYRFARKSRRETGFSQKNWLEPRPAIRFSGSTSQNYRFARKSRRETGFSQKNWLEPRFALPSDLL